MSKDKKIDQDVVLNENKKKELVKYGRQLKDRFNELIKPMYEIPHEGGRHEAKINK